MTDHEMALEAVKAGRRAGEALKPLTTENLTEAVSFGPRGRRFWASGFASSWTEAKNWDYRQFDTCRRLVSRILDRYVELGYNPLEVGS